VKSQREWFSQQAGNGNSGGERWFTHLRTST
jgi:hypothetical protein